MQTKSISIWIPGQAVSWKAPVGGARNRYTPKKAKQYQKLVQACAVKAGAKSIYSDDELYQMQIIIYKKKPQRCKADSFELCKGRQDVDNIVKNIKDGLEHIAYKNDNQVVLHEACQVLSPSVPGVRIIIEQVQEKFLTMAATLYGEDVE